MSQPSRQCLDILSMPSRCCLDVVSMLSPPCLDVVSVLSRGCVHVVSMLSRSAALSRLDNGSMLSRCRFGVVSMSLLMLFQCCIGAN
eukprot:1315565-Lingulodinium_polyedra.AAC.1